MHRKKQLLLLLALLLAVLPGCGQKHGALDYSLPENWAYHAEGAGRDGDVFLVCPTVDLGADGNTNMPVTDETMRARFVGALNMERGLYEDALTLYAPYYRQVSLPVYDMTEQDAAPYLDIAYRDVRSAFLSFCKESPDRPFVLAGFSQGSEMVLRLLSEFFDRPAYQNRLIAAYCIGWRVTDADLAACPWLCMAEREDDTGVIVCFSSEAEWIQDSLIVPAGVKTYAINPLNWKTDATPASRAENRGACFPDKTGAITKEVLHLTGAYLDPVRGTLKLPDISPADYANALFPDGVYHLYDYQFFYRNLQENVQTRTKAYFAAQAGAGLAGAA